MAPLASSPSPAARLTSPSSSLHLCFLFLLAQPPTPAVSRPSIFAVGFRARRWSALEARLCPMSKFTLWPRVQGGGGGSRGGCTAPSRKEHDDRRHSRGTFLKLEDDHLEDDESAKSGADDIAGDDDDDSPAPSQFLASPPLPPCCPDDEKRWPLPRPRLVDGEIPNYRPLVLRRPTLACLIALLVALIILVELSVHMLPNDNSPATLLPRTLELRGRPSDAGAWRSRSRHGVIAKRGDDQREQVLDIVETTLVIVEADPQPIDGTRVKREQGKLLGPRPSSPKTRIAMGNPTQTRMCDQLTNLAFSQGTEASMTLTLVTPAPQMKKRIRKNPKLADECKFPSQSSREERLCNGS